MKINLGCGNDVRSGYVNVDYRPIPQVKVVDLSKIPWPFEDKSADEILALDFLEHFPYKLAIPILDEVYRILKFGAFVDIQCPDLMECSRAASFEHPFLCNRCGWEFPISDTRADLFICKNCKQGWKEIALAAAHRLYGGQDYEGNWHFNAFTPLLLRRILDPMGFGKIEDIQLNENGETYRQNWNFKIRAYKTGDPWGDE